MKKGKKNEVNSRLTKISKVKKLFLQLTNRCCSCYRITDSALESLPQLIVYGIFCLTYYYGNSLIHIFLNNTSTSNIILFASSLPLSLYSVISGINVYSSPNGKQHYVKTISLTLQVLSRITAVLSFISPIYAVYYTAFKSSFESSVLSASEYLHYSWVPYFLTTSLVSITYPHIVSLLLMSFAIFTFHGIFIFVYSSKNIPEFSYSPFFQKITHTLANLLIVLPWRPFGWEGQRRKFKEQQNLQIAMAVSNIFLFLVSSLCRSYTAEKIIYLGLGTKTHLAWISFDVNLDSPSTLPLLAQLSPYHHHIGLLLNLAAHIPWLLLTLGLQALGIFTMTMFYKKFHPWREINSVNIYNAPTVQEIITVNVTEEEASLLESDIEWVDEDDMEDDTEMDDDEAEGIQLGNGEPLEMRDIVQQERRVNEIPQAEQEEEENVNEDTAEESRPVQIIQDIIDEIILDL